MTFRWIMALGVAGFDMEYQQRRNAFTILTMSCFYFLFKALPSILGHCPFGFFYIITIFYRILFRSHCFLG
jgi:hypothetical protein